MEHTDSGTITSVIVGWSYLWSYVCASLHIDNDISARTIVNRSVPNNSTIEASKCAILSGSRKRNKRVGMPISHKYLQAS